MVRANLLARRTFVGVLRNGPECCVMILRYHVENIILARDDLSVAYGILASHVTVLLGKGESFVKTVS